MVWPTRAAARGPHPRPATVEPRPRKETRERKRSRSLAVFTLRPVLAAVLGWVARWRMRAESSVRGGVIRYTHMGEQRLRRGDRLLGRLDVVDVSKAAVHSRVSRILAVGARALALAIVVKAGHDLAVVYTLLSAAVDSGSAGFTGQGRTNRKERAK